MQTQDIIGLVLVYAIIALSLGVMMFCRKRGYDIDGRKIIHTGVGFFVFVWWIFTANWIMLVFFTVPFAVIVFLAMFDGNPISRTDLGDVSNRMGHRIGLFLYVVSINIMVLFFFDGHWTAATIGMVAMTFGDSAGSVIGRRFGRHHIIEKKSVEGTLGVFAATAVVTFVILSLYAFVGSIGMYSGTTDAIVPSWAVCVIAGAVASVSEMICPGQYDNLANSLSVALVMVALGL